MSPRRWTREELKELIELYPTTEIELLMKKFGRSRRSIMSKACALRVQQTSERREKQNKSRRSRATWPRKGWRVWPAEIVKQILIDYPNTSNIDLAVKYNATPVAIRCVANTRGVKKSEEFLSACGRKAALRMNEILKQGKAA